MNVHPGLWGPPGAPEDLPLKAMARGIARQRESLTAVSCAPGLPRAASVPCFPARMGFAAAAATKKKQESGAATKKPR